MGQPAACRRRVGGRPGLTGVMPTHLPRSFKKSSAEKIMKAVLEDKMAYTNERDGTG